MKRSLRNLTVFAGVLVLVMVMNVSAAWASHDNPHFEGTTAATATAPVGSNISAAGFTNGFGDGDPSTPAVVAIDKNPNCPLHYLP